MRGGFGGIEGGSGGYIGGGKGLGGEGGTGGKDGDGLITLTPCVKYVSDETLC
tara:strand:- start:315 stop:473 length:159 start_codon:yes stop_codon:yes gene_type:complete